MGAVAVSSGPEASNSGGVGHILDDDSRSDLNRKVIDKLEAKDGIRSRIKPEDNRVQLVSLTTAGRGVIPELAQITDHNDDRFFAFLDPRERGALRDLLIKLADHHQIRDVPLE